MVTWVKIAEAREDALVMEDRKREWKCYVCEEVISGKGVKFWLCAHCGGECRDAKHVKWVK